MGEDEENQLTAEEQEVYRKIKEKKKMKKKKIKLEQQLQQQEMELGEKIHLMEESDEREQRKKKKKKNKIKLEEQQQQQEIELEEKTQLIEENDEKENRKKKKKKRKGEDTVDEHEEQKEIPLKEVEVAEEEKEEEMEEEIVEEVNARVEVVGKKEDKFAPIVCYYPSGFNPQRKMKNSEEEEDDEGVEVKTFRTETRVEVVVTPKDYKLDFVGESHSGEPAASQVCCYSLAIFDKESQTLKIVPVAANKILRLEPKVRTSSICEKEPLKELKEEDQTPAKKAHDIDRIITAYGTKTANRNAKRLQNLHRPEDAETQKAIDEKTQNVKLNKKALDTASGAPTRNIPPHDSTADTPEKAYPIDRIILPGEWDSLLDILELVQSQADIKPDTYPSFVCNRVHKLLEIQDEEERKKLACIFSYITHLIKFRDQRSVDRNSSIRNRWTPTILITKFMSMFADSEKYNPSPEKINLLISYVLVLTLIADGYQTDIADIARDLRMSVVDLREHYFNLGCKAKKEEKVMMLTLPTPLEFPKLRMRGPKRKR